MSVLACGYSVWIIEDGKFNIPKCERENQEDPISILPECDFKGKNFVECPRIWKHSHNSKVSQ